MYACVIITRNNALDNKFPPRALDSNQRIHSLGCTILAIPHIKEVSPPQLTVVVASPARDSFIFSYSAIMIEAS